ncbi:MAG: RDD family protein [Candidatus Eremiobacteraeota bacterium]|nr:RDD family protein [Candidatus Eremiobacteraeota bacterium]
MSTPPPPSGDDLEATVAMPRVTPPPPPQRRVIEPAVVEPVRGTVIPPPGVTVVPERRPDVGNPLGYVAARFFAFALDLVLIAVFATTLMYSLIAINPITGLPNNNETAFDATLALGTALALVYVWVSEALFGTTIGKLVFGLHVFALRERGVGLARAFLRGLLRPIDLLLIGGILALLPAHRRLGDFAAGTIVGRSPLRGFAPLLGWVLVLVICGIPVVLIGFGGTMRSLITFYEFVPNLAVHAWHGVQSVATTFRPR